MSIKAILFDLDGTLLPMDQDEFTADYFKRLVEYLTPYGYDSKELFNVIMEGVVVMMKNDGIMTNEQAFWGKFREAYGDRADSDYEHFDRFYRTEFEKVRESCGFSDRSAEIVAEAKAAGFRIALATNPLFPHTATESRIRWAGLDPSDFELVTTYETESCAKPNPSYYKAIAERMGLTPDQCLMVGNDTRDDLSAESVGMKVFILTPWLINKKNIDLSPYPHGDHDDLIKYIKNIK